MVITFSALQHRLDRPDIGAGFPLPPSPSSSLCLIAGASTAAAAGRRVCCSVGVSLKVGAVELPAMAELDPFGVPAGGSALGNGVAGEEDPAAAFLAQQESEIAGIENDEAFAILDGGAPGPQPHGEPPGVPGACGCFPGGSAAPETAHSGSESSV